MFCSVICGAKLAESLQVHAFDSRGVEILPESNGSHEKLYCEVSCFQLIHDFSITGRVWSLNVVCFSDLGDTCF